jgi:hypothetical protein
MQSKNVIYWNPILRGCDTHWHGKEFLKHFGRMFEENAISYLITVVCLLSTCKLASLVDESISYYASLIATYMIFTKFRVQGSNSKKKRFWLETFIVTYNLI